MAVDPEFYQSEEKRSYSAVFLLAVALLLACSVWAIWQDSFSRHLWKKIKADFYRVAIARYEDELTKEDERLRGNPDFVELVTELDEVRESLEDGEAARELERLEDELHDAEIRVQEADLDLRIVKSEIEEAWYLLEKAQHEGESGAEEHRRLEELEERKQQLEKKYDDAVRARDDIKNAIKQVRAREEDLLAKLREWHKQKEAIELKLDSVSWQVFGRRIPKIPTIDQVVLPSFERNNFEQWVDRVDRCMNCHVAIDRAGFEDLENPLKTHPNRKYYLGNHEVRRFGCTPCHGGQGPSVNSVEQAHGFVQFWEDPLLDPRDRVQSKCLTCHLSAQSVEGAEVVARGEWLFREMGCHGCHLIEEFADQPKAGPSLKRIAAKVSPEWLVDWIEEPKRFRPRTRMPHFFLSRDESIAVAAYVLGSSLPDSRAWLESHPEPAGVDPSSSELVEEGKRLTRTLGCLGCHGFEPEAYASQVAIGKDTAPNLARIAEKTGTRWLYHWIRDPRGYSETARMPSLRLEEQEARAIASYLATLKQDAPPAPDPDLRAKLADPKMYDEGAKLIRKYGCFGCHWINGMEGESRVSVELNAFADKHVEELFFGDRIDLPQTWDAWTLNKILTPRTYATERIEQNMPEFGFDEKDARALVVFLGGQSVKKINPHYRPDVDGWEAKLKHGRDLVSYYNCNGCHSFDGREGAIRKYYEENPENAPPILVGEGKKVQPEWFVDFLMKPVRLRPWLDVRMPTFGLRDDEASAIVEYFQALDGYELGPVVVDLRDGPGAVMAAHRRYPQEYFDCYACHPRGPGRPDERSYTISRKPLTDAEIRRWAAEHLGIELGPTGDEQQAAVEELRSYLGGGAN